jgi:hypothetical protein
VPAPSAPGPGALETLFGDSSFASVIRTFSRQGSKLGFGGGGGGSVGEGMTPMADSL